jgi:polysaccharide export outer membrane protein
MPTLLIKGVHMIASPSMRLSVAFSIILVVAVAVPLHAEYTIGPQDVLQISFWQQPALDQTVTVRADGKITISIIGEIAAAGLTPPDLARKIGERANYHNPAISQAAVTVIGYFSQKVFINGQVLRPGPYAFEELPDIWTLIKEAGGITPFADLSKVTLIRGSKDAGRIESINVDNLVAAGKYDDIPKLNPGDIVEIPALVGGMTGAGLPKSETSRLNLVFVTGAVARPGPVNLDEHTDVLDVIILSGGSTADADLENVRVISKQESYSSVMTVDIEKYAASGAPRRYILKPEDTVVIPRKKGNALWIGWGTFRDVIAVTASVLSAVALVDRMGKD